ncbi:TPA: SHOCT domain-containing protein [Bacillus thuringiensis]|nr:SHOCT domain-containing protein [Bacillus thuringiensis]
MDEQHSPAPTNTSLDVADQIKKLADLRDSCILTNEEFDAKKKQLLGI